MDSNQERDCVCRARAGDRAAFTALVDRYWDPIRAWLAGLLGQAHAAEDLAQETFLKAWTNLPGLIAEETFRVWLFRIARNEFLAFRRSPRAASPRQLPAIASQHAGPLQEAEEREATVALRTEIEKLPETYRDAYLLWTHERMGYPEIARILDTTEEAARTRVCEARRRLATAVRRFLENDPR